MKGDSFGKVSIIYDFFEKNVIKDYQGSIKILEKNMKFGKNDTVIDVGGGTGYITDHFVDNFQKGVVLDLSRIMLSRNKNSKILKIEADGAYLPLRNDIADVAILNAVLHHVDYKKQQFVLEECFRILKPKGTLVIIESAALEKFFAKLFRIIERVLIGKTYFIPPENLEKKLNKIGFKEIKKIFPKKQDWKYAIKTIK